MGSWGRGEKGTCRLAAVGLRVTVGHLQVFQRELARQWEVGGRCGEGKRKPWGGGRGLLGMEWEWGLGPGATLAAATHSSPFGL